MPGDGRRDRGDGEESLTIHEARTRVAAAVATPIILVGLAWVSFLLEAARGLTAILALLAAGLGYVAFFDFPRTIVFDGEGVHRLSLLRHWHIPWSEVARIVKPRRRGLILVSRSGKSHVLVDRRLEEGELRILRIEAERHQVSTSF